MTHACVLVMGDVGRSPRMCFHALSLARQEGIAHVSLVGYQVTKLPTFIANDPKIRPVHIRPPPDFLQYLPSLLAYAIKLMWISISLLLTLVLRVGRIDLIIVQNPPALPMLAICVTYVKTWWRGRLIVDWHNYSYSVLQASLEFDAKTGERRRNAEKHVLVRLTRWFEAYWARKADLSFCVTKAMREDLAKWCKVTAITLYDRPPSWKFSSFQSIDRKALIDERHELVLRLSEEHFMKAFQGQAEEGEDQKYDQNTAFTHRQRITGVISERMERPALVISSTSWTVDEDFGVLLDALLIYDKAVEKQRTSKGYQDTPESDLLPNIVAVITGRGPQKARYMTLMGEMPLKHVDIVTPWLQSDDYPVMLRAADVGVSLHTSTCGVDLPMKVVDMLGSGVPALSCDFEAIGELVKHNVNGLVFKSRTQLANQLQRLLRGFPRYSNDLNLLRDHVRDTPMVPWEDNWSATAWPHIRHLLYG